MLGRSLFDEDDETDDDGRRFLVQKWGGGTPCDKTGLPRRVEVQVRAFTHICGSLVVVFLDEIDIRMRFMPRTVPL